MEIFKNFFECYFHQNEPFDSLDGIIEDIKNPNDDIYRLTLITELHQIIQKKVMH